MENQKQILVVFTGGTICTTIKNGEMDTDSRVSVALLDFYKNSNSYCKDKVQLVKGENFNILSENMTVCKWNKLIDYFQNILKNDFDYDGIIVAHGTDTLAYTTAMFSILLKGISVPVVFVSSNNPIMNEDGTKNPLANGVENFKSAVERIYKGLPAGVYATYENTEDNKMYLHKGENLIQCAIYDDNFYSRDVVDITNLENVEFSKSEPNNINIPIVNMGEKRLIDCILKINPYVGLNYNMYNLENVKAVLHSTYHSGTSCVEKTEEQNDYSENSILYFIDKCAEKNIPFYYSPSKRGEQQTVYASIPFIENHIANSQKAHFCYGNTEELVYCKLLYAYSVDLPQDEICELLNN
ncbi:MAG: asparaginase [Clostridia bacterium]|nr:asparaginase [Clostridia bacterium]